MIYKYSPVQGHEDNLSAIYPLVPLFLMYNHQFIKNPLFGLVDSGAEVCYCYKPIGEYLHINFKNKKRIISKAANGTNFTGYQETVQFLVAGKNISAPCIFSEDVNPTFSIILGQNGFFSNFQVCFEKTNNTFSLN